MQRVRCLHCQKSYLPADFEITKTIGDKIYRRRKCKFCKWKTQRQRVRRIYAWLVEYKKKQACQSCGIRDHRVLTFHHRTGTEKLQNVADLAGRGWSLIKSAN